MKKLMLTVVGLISLSQFSNISYSAEVLTNKTSDVSRKVIQQADILGSNEELRMMLVEFPPSYSNIVHIHPVGGLCFVIQGTAESQYEGEELKVFHADDSYQDQANKKHLIFRNASDSDILKFTCTAKIKKDQQFMLPLGSN
jgi:quercetin dioxygenase-like cupin family protein